MSLSLLSPPGSEPISPSELKGFLRLDSDAEDDLLFHLIKTARQAVEAYTARSLIRQGWLFRINAGYCLAQTDTSYISGNRGGNMRGIELPRAPFLGLLKNPYIEIGSDTKEIQDFRLDTAGRLARIHVGASAGGLFEGRANMCIEFSAGYGDDGDSVPSPIRHAILMAAGDLYENRTGMNDNRSVPPCLNGGVTELLKPYRSLRL